MLQKKVPLALKLLSNKAKLRGNKLAGRFFNGFSLVEILIVIATLGFLAAIAVPGISEWIETFKFRNTVREIGITMQVARIKAITSGVEFRVVFDLDEETFSLEKGNQAEGSDTWLLEGLVNDVSSWADIAFVNSYATGSHNKQFNPNGTSSSGSIRLTNAKEKKYRITLTPATGYIKVNEGW